MKAVFISTSHRTIPILEELNKAVEIVLCVTKTDVKVGREQTIKENEIKLWAIKNNKKCIQVENLKGENLEKVRRELTKTRPDFGMAVDCGFILPKVVIDSFPRGIVNIHFSLLPKYRGASPAQFVILNGESKTGITFQSLAEKLDEGDILRQIEYPLGGNETSGDLYETLFSLASANIGKFVQDYLEGKITTQKQNETKASYTYSPTHPTRTTVFKEDAYTNCKEINGDPTLFNRKVRAYNPWPIVWTWVKDFENNYLKPELKCKFRDKVNKQLRLKIYETSHEKNSNNIKINKLQIEGSKILGWKEFENGYLEAL